MGLVVVQDSKGSSLEPVGAMVVGEVVQVLTTVCQLFAEVESAVVEAVVELLLMMFCRAAAVAGVAEVVVQLAQHHLLPAMPD